MTRILYVAALLIGTAAAGLADSTARVVHYHANDIVAVRAKMRYTTMIQIPAGEKVIEAATGDKDFWIIDAIQNFCFLHPAKEGIHSNLNLITDKGNVYSFTLDEVKDGDPDLKVVIEPSEPSMVAAINGAPKFVPASDIEGSKLQAQSAQLQARQQLAQFKSEYPVKALKFDYAFKSEKPFEVTAIYHDGQFTYIKSSALEKFAVYELKDGKPDSINFELRDGTYVIPKIVDHGYLQIGKKRMAFVRLIP
jgi:type IV secretion system protein VirB9